MRQIGFICAAAFVALQENVGKLEADHKKAKVLAGKLLVYLMIICQNLPIKFIDFMLGFCMVFRGAKSN